MKKNIFWEFIKKHKIAILLILVMATAIFFRLYKLGQIPPGLYPDVAINGNDALQALKSGDFKAFYPENNGREGLFMNLIAASFWLFGASVWAIKIVPAILGILTILGIYLLTFHLFSFGRLMQKKFSGDAPKYIGLLAAFFTAVSFWHVNFSRLGFRAIMAPFCLVWSFYFLFKGIKNLKNYPEKSNVSAWMVWVYWILGGAFFGLGFHTYIAFRIAPVILVPAFIAAIILFWQDLKSHKKGKISRWKAGWNAYKKNGWWGWDVFIIAAVLVFLPLGIYYLQNPADFMGRSSQVSVFASPNPAKTLIETTIKTLGQFVAFGDYNWRHNLPGSPQIFYLLIPFFLIGLGWCACQIFRKENYKEKGFFSATVFWTLLIWFGAMLMPSIMTNEGLPHALRTIGAIPPSYIFTGLGFYLILSRLMLFPRKLASLKLRRSGRESRPIKSTWIPACSLPRSCGARMTNENTKIILGFLVFIFLIIISCLSYRQYFIQWGFNKETRGAFTQLFVDQANYLNSLPANMNKYVLVNEGGVRVPYPNGIPMPAQTIIFLTQDQPSIKYLSPDPGNVSYLPDKNSVILPMNPNEEIFKTLKQKFPQGRVEDLGNFKAFVIK